MGLNPASLPKCSDCPVPSGTACFHQSILHDQTGTGGVNIPLDPIYDDDDDFKETVVCANRRTGALNDLEVWRVQNQAYLSSGGSEFPSSYVTGDGFDPEDGDITWTGPYDS